MTVIGPLLSPSAAAADCGVPADGVPQGVISNLAPAFHKFGGLRPALVIAGIDVGGTYYAELFGNPVGGFKRSADYDGVLELHVNSDLHELGLWKGLCFHTNGFEIHGQGITADNLGGLMPVSSLEATPATRLDELWLEQHLFGDKLAIRIGQLAADTEFIMSIGGNFFLNSTWGWPSIATADLPGGGPAYPLATPGVRAAITPGDKVSLLVGLYNGDPAPSCASDNPQVCNPNGLDFELDDPPLLIVEGTYKFNQDRLAGQIKLGGWNHFGTFQRLSGVSRGPFDDNYSLYVIVDQTIWRASGSGVRRDVALFGRAMGAPSDRNLVNFYADGGVTFSGVIADRPADSFGVGLAYTGIDAAEGLSTARSYQALIEFCYTLQMASGWTLQPDLQYLWQPGHAVGSEADGVALNSALVLGIRSSMSF